ncbi:MAG: hypothetical protein DME57_08685 [Verrucomicrobia bacterium]|nr:MAG: hypothetical protein DME57_08685 [Verrucomicrobiota bacterium]
MRINDQPVPVTSVPNWKQTSILDVAKFLRAGENKMEARVFNNDAPPALWLRLVADSTALSTDAKWESSIAGSSWRNAALASVPREPGHGNPLAGGERIFDVIPRVWPAWIFFGILAAGGAIALSRWIRTDDVDLSRGVAFLLVVVCCFAWAILFWNNTKTLPFLSGYDFKDHVAYIKYIQDRGALPLPNEGYEMFQPPLFYALSAGLLSTFHLSTGDAAAVVILRGLTMLFGIANFVFAFLSLRLLLPRNPLAQMAALIMAAFSPMQLYLSHYVTNEVCAATLATMSIYFALHALRSERVSLWQSIVLGICVGAAMLAKATSLLLLPSLIGALAIKLWQERAPISEWVRAAGSTTAVILLVCGWHYLRIWRHFGTPIVGNWDPVLGFPWWQDPGFHTAADYFRFGRSLIAPMFSGFNGFAAGIYSTLWGDSLGGGLAGILSRTPWNYNLMITGYWLAIIPTLLVLIGAAIALYRFARKISAPWFLLIAFSATIAVALIFMTLRVPSYAQVKAFYGLAGLVPFCAFVALGLETLSSRSRILRMSIFALLIFVSVNSFASIWIRRTPEQYVYSALRLITQSQPDRAIAEANAAVAMNPSNPEAAYVLAAVLDETGASDKAIAECERCLKLDSANGDCHLQLGVSAGKSGDLTRAMSEAHRALELLPEDARVYDLLFGAARGLRRSEDVVKAGRDAIALSPFDPDLHYRIGLAAGEIGDFKTATQQFAYALLLKPTKSEHEQKLRIALSFLAQTPDATNVIRDLQPLATGSPKLLEILAGYRQDPDSTPQDRQ